MLLAQIALFSDFQNNMLDIKELLFNYRHLAKKIEIEYTVQNTEINEAGKIINEILGIIRFIYKKDIDRKISLIFDSAFGRDNKKLSVKIYDRADHYISFY